MRALRGLGFGALTGLGAGVAIAFAVALLVGLSVATGLGQDPVDDVIGEAALAVFVVAAYGAVVGGFIGGIVGAAMGAILGAGGWERHARWAASSVLVVFVGVITTLATEGRFELDGVLVGGMFATVLGAQGYAAGIVFERMAAVRPTPVFDHEPLPHDVFVG